MSITDHSLRFAGGAGHGRHRALHRALTGIVRDGDRDKAVHRTASAADAAAAAAERDLPFIPALGLLAQAALRHDGETSRHTARVNEYSYFLAIECGMPRDFAEEIRYSAQLHDVGKLGISTRLLRKAGRLTRRERFEMDLHPLYGFVILRALPNLRMAAEIALHHHEKWDGTGYPQGVRGKRIPLAARIVAIADIYDALRSPRAYKPALCHRAAVAIMLRGDRRIDPSGHFDPALLAVLRRRHEGMDHIHRRLSN